MKMLDIGTDNQLTPSLDAIIILYYIIDKLLNVIY